MKAQLKTGAIIRREMEIWRKKPVYIIGSVGVMAFCSIFFLTFFKEGLPEDLPIGIVDNDGTLVSREFARQLDATQLGKVVKYDTFTDAREDMMKGKLTSVCVLPENMYEDIIAGRQPEITCYFNDNYLIGSALAYKDILTLVNMADGAVKREVLRAGGMNDKAIMGMIQPINVDTHQIGNACTNYGYYLTNMLLPGILEMVVIIILIYSLGTELKYGTSRELLRTAGNSITTVLTGKLLIYTVLFSVLGIIMEFMLYDRAHFPINGSVLNMIVNVILLVLASEAIAVFLFGCIPMTRLALSLGALYSIIGFSLAGFTFPVEAMPAIIRGWSAAFPLRHYYLFYIQEVIFGTGFPGWWQDALHLLLFLFLPLTVLPRIKRAYIYQNFPQE